MQFAKKTFFRGYYEPDMLSKYENDTIESMFYEFDDQEKFCNFEALSNYNDSIIKGLVGFFSTSDHNHDTEKVNLI